MFSTLYSPNQPIGISTNWSWNECFLSKYHDGKFLIPDVALLMLQKSWHLRVHLHGRVSTNLNWWPDFGGMYSSNEYESLELEPKLLISVSPLDYPNGGWYGAGLMAGDVAERCGDGCGCEEVIFSFKDKWLKPDKMQFMTVVILAILWPELDDGNRHFWTSNPSASVWKPRMLNIHGWSWSPVAMGLILHWGSWVQPAEWMKCQDMLVASADLQGHTSIFCQDLELLCSFFPNPSLLELEQTTKILKNHWVDVCRYVMTSCWIESSAKAFLSFARPSSCSICWS